MWGASLFGHAVPFENLVACGSPSAPVTEPRIEPMSFANKQDLYFFTLSISLIFYPVTGVAVSVRWLLPGNEPTWKIAGFISFVFNLFASPACFST